MADVFQAARDVLADYDRGGYTIACSERTVLIARGVLAMMEDASKLCDLVKSDGDVKVEKLKRVLRQIAQEIRDCNGTKYGLGAAQSKTILDMTFPGEEHGDGR